MSLFKGNISKEFNDSFYMFLYHLNNYSAKSYFTFALFQLVLKSKDNTPALPIRINVITNKKILLFWKCNKTFLGLRLDSLFAKFYVHFL